MVGRERVGRVVGTGGSRLISASPVGSGILEVVAVVVVMARSGRRAMVVMGLVACRGYSLSPSRGCEGTANETPAGSGCRSGARLVSLSEAG